MRYTKHGHVRMSQRAINAEMIEILRRFGEIDGNRLCLDNTAIQGAIKYVDSLRSGLGQLTNNASLAPVTGGRRRFEDTVLQAAIRYLDRLRSGLVRLMDKGGLAAVFGDGGCLVTAHSCEDHCSGRRRRPRRGAWQAA